ncbi:DUF6414 family protein [Micromonospora eburnea]|uniref:DUF6414 family protein n=1 Tax=Micromonospora eburnea TaxID=227316 RepID=UPI00114CB786|nr:hypothetical protein [Micromonospora eburnea]
MSVFRSPLYLDTETLVPLANYYDIQVMVDVAVTQRDLGQRSGKAGFNAAVPIPGSPGIELGGSKGSESEVTQARTIKDHPTNALNRLLDALTLNGDVATDLSGGAVTRRQLVEVDADWIISPATDAGAFLTMMATFFAQNPSARNSTEPPPEFFSLMTSGPIPGSMVLDATLEDADETHVLVLLDAGHLAGRAGPDDLEGERTIFGQVDALVAEGTNYSLDKFFLSGFSRAIRRTLPLEELLKNMPMPSEKPVTIDNLKIGGPLVVVKAIAIY